MVTMQNMQSKLEVWRNTANGMRWYQSHDLQGRPKSKTVMGGRTFTITAFERQINQDQAADPSLDTFRNGTFVLLKPSEETNLDEVMSPDALTDEEIVEGVREIMYGDKTVEGLAGAITSAITLRRILEQLVAEDASAEVIAEMRELLAKVEPAVPTRVIVSTADNAESTDR